MKKNNTHKSATRPRTTAVHIEFQHSAAATIGIAGTFNDWRPSATPMIPVGEGRWVKQLALPPGVYEYRLVVDGQWITDPQSSETKPNPFGGLNSVLKVNGCSR